MDESKRIPIIETVNKFSIEKRKENLEKILSYKRPDLFTLKPEVRDLKAVILAGGPTIDHYIDKIKTLQSEDYKIFCIERMYPWCHKHDITPEYVVVLDASDDVVEGFTHINPETMHLVSVQANPEVMELLKDHKVVVFNSVQKGLDSKKTWEENGYYKVMVVNSGGSVSLAAMVLSVTLGAVDVRIFGFDCCFNGREYADGIVGIGENKDPMEVDIEGRRFLTTLSYMAFMQQFFFFYIISINNKIAHTIKVYGDNLVNFAAKVPEINGDK